MEQLEDKEYKEYAERLAKMGFSKESISNALLYRHNQLPDLEPIGDKIGDMAMAVLSGRSPLTPPESIRGSSNGIPKRYFGDTPEQVATAFTVLRKDADDYISKTSPAWPGLLIYGGLGVGKTSVAIEFMHLFSKASRSSLFETLWYMVARVKHTWGEESDETEFAALEHYIRPDLLVVDEVGVQFGTVAERNILYAVVVSRYNKLRPTILTTNCLLDTKEGLQEFFNGVGTRVADRFQGYDVNASKWGNNLRAKCQSAGN